MEHHRVPIVIPLAIATSFGGAAVSASQWAANHWTILLSAGGFAISAVAGVYGIRVSKATLKLREKQIRLLEGRATEEGDL